MEIKRNQSIEDWAMGEIQNNWGSETREGIHLSDLLAPRKKYWQTIKPMKPSLKEISYWTSGNAIEDKFLKAIGYGKGETREWQGIFYSPDTFFNFPAEIKTRRRALAKEGEEAQVYDHYLKQLKGYCAVEGKQKGWLIVLSLAEKQDNNKTMPEWRYYDVMFTQEELGEERQRLINMWTLLCDSIIRKVHGLLPECPQWMCQKKIITMTLAPKCLTCNKEFKSELNLKKHIESKVGKEHEIKKGEYESNVIPECKWFYDCNPKT